MDANEKIVRDFAEGWESGRLMEVFDEYFHEDLEWHNSGVPTVQGKAACMEMAAQFTEVFPVIRGEIKALAAQGDVVLFERVDHPTLASGEPGPELEVVGSIRIKDGKIVYWYDYFDPRPILAAMENQAAATQ